MNQYVLPVKREIWEHSGAFIKAPIIVMALIVVALLLSLIVGSRYVDWQGYQQDNYASAQTGSAVQEKPEPGVRYFEYEDRVLGDVDAPISHHGVERFADHNDVREGAQIMSYGPYAVFTVMIFFISISYCLSSLHADRKDGSVLFWKSMPVGEWQTVLTKLFVALVVLSVIGLVAGAMLSIAVFVLALATALASGIDGAVMLVLTEQRLLSAFVDFLGSYLAASLWCLPAVSWLLLASAMAKRAPFLVATVPLAVITLFEKVVFNSHFFVSWFISHLFCFAPGTGQPMIQNPSAWQVVHVLGSLQFWFGLVVSGGLLYGAVWFRENRFEQA